MESFIETVRTLTGQPSSFGKYFAEPSSNLDRIVRTPSLSCPNIDGTVMTRSLFNTSSLGPIPEDGPLVTSSTYSVRQENSSHIADASKRRQLVRRTSCGSFASSVIDTRRNLDCIRSAYAQAMTVILRDAQRSAKRLLDTKFQANSCYSFEKLQARFATYTDPSGLTEALMKMLREGSQRNDFRSSAGRSQRTLSEELAQVRQGAQGTRPDMWVNIEPSVDNVIVAVGIDVFYRVWRNGLASPLLLALAWSHFHFQGPQMKDKATLRVCFLVDMIAFQTLVLMKLDELFLEWIRLSQPEEDTIYVSEWETEDLLDEY